MVHEDKINRFVELTSCDRSRQTCIEEAKNFRGLFEKAATVLTFNHNEDVWSATSNPIRFPLPRRIPPLKFSAPPTLVTGSTQHPRGRNKRRCSRTANCNSPFDETRREPVTPKRSARTSTDEHVKKPNERTFRENEARRRRQGMYRADQPAFPPPSQPQPNQPQDETSG